MTVEEAISLAETILPGEAAPDGETDTRWQAIIEVSEFIGTEPEAVWSFARKWGAHADGDLRMAVATCVLEHLLEQHFDAFISRVEDAAKTDRLFADTVAACATAISALRKDSSAWESRADRFDQLLEVRKRNRLNQAFLAGESIPGIKFRYNSQVSFVGNDGVRHEGWIVGVAPIEPAPVYTVERRDGGEDEEVREADLELILDPIERPEA